MPAASTSRLPLKLTDVTDVLHAWKDGPPGGRQMSGYCLDRAQDLRDVRQILYRSLLHCLERCRRRLVAL